MHCAKKSTQLIQVHIAPAALQCCEGKQFALQRSLWGAVMPGDRHAGHHKRSQNRTTDKQDKIGLTRASQVKRVQTNKQTQRYTDTQGRGYGQAQSQRPAHKCKFLLIHGHFCPSVLPMATFVSDLRTVLWGRNSDHNGDQWLPRGAVKHGKSIHSLPRC